VKSGSIHVAVFGSVLLAVHTGITGDEYPGTTAPYWGEETYSGFYQQKGIEDGAERRK